MLLYFLFKKCSYVLQHVCFCKMLLVLLIFGMFILLAKVKSWRQRMFTYIHYRSGNENHWCDAFVVIYQTCNPNPCVPNWHYGVWQARVLLCDVPSSLFCKYLFSLHRRSAFICTWNNVCS